MCSLLRNLSGSGVRASAQKCAVTVQVPHLSTLPRQHQTRCSAKRREVEPTSFSDVYLAMQERVATNGTLPKVDGRIMVESIRSLEHGQRVLQLIARHVATKNNLAGALELDWPVRRRWLERICQLALRLPNCKPLILDIFANADVFALSTYFGAEMVEMLAASGAETSLLARIVELFCAKRQPGDKGVTAAYQRLMQVLKNRKDDAAVAAASAAFKVYRAPPPSAAPVAVVEAAVAAITPAAAPATVTLLPATQ